RLRTGEGPRLMTEVGDRHRQQRHGDALTRGQQHVELTAGRQRGDLLRQIEELVGGVAHRRDHHDDVVPGFFRRDDPLRDPLDTGRIGDGRTTVFLYNERHEKSPSDKRLWSSQFTAPSHGRPPRYPTMWDGRADDQAGVCSSTTSSRVCATSACSARIAAPTWLPQVLKYEYCHHHSASYGRPAR